MINCEVACQLITIQYQYVLNLRCVAYCLNLISGDILKHNFADWIHQKCSIIVTFFNKSHQTHALLLKLINDKGIQGGGLKNYIKTHWTSVYECTSSIYHLKSCLEEVKSYNF